MKLLSLLFTCTLLFGAPTNALINSHSPYLLQHAHNPVNWFPWIQKALQKAKTENKLIFLSIGYSTCHWCHVMEKESFENQEVAKLLNADYISIKVDKEQMPHIDTHFQNLLVNLKDERRGWPLNAILSPNQKVIYITTYIPPTDSYGVEGLKTLLPKIAQQWKENKKQIYKIVTENQKILKTKKVVHKSKIQKDRIASVYLNLMKKRFDKTYKGFDKNPKFILPTHLQTLLTIYQLEDNKEAFSMVKQSLDTMSYGGIYDQIEGGFYRYSASADWIVPHFEKMLYTQAEVISLYTKFYILSPKARYKGIVLDTIKEVNKRFGYKGLYFSATNADSKYGEGRYYVYTFDEVKNAFIKAHIKNHEEVMDYLDITEIGNFKDEFSNVQLHTGFDKAPIHLKKAFQVLKELRKTREFPFTDKKILTGWNSLMIKSLFIASYFNKNLQIKAEQSLKKLLQKVYIRGTLYHGFYYNKSPEHKALLEDYVYLVDLLQTAYMYTYNKAYLQLSGYMLKQTLQKFYKNHKFYLDDTAFKAEASYIDKYYVSPLSRLFHVLLTQANLTYDLKLLAKTREFLKNQKDIILQHPDKYPEAVRALLRSNNGDVLVKSNKQNLTKKLNDILQLKYPFVLRKIQNTNKYLACDEKTCFAIDKKFENIVKYIKQYKENNDRAF